MAFYYLPEDREREAKLHAKEMQELRDKKANAKYPQDKTSILVRQLRSAIKCACPKHLSERQAIRRQFALFDEDESGVVDYKEFKLAIKKYMNGVEEEDILHIFQHFDKDNSKTLSVEEFTDLLLKEAGPHNFSYKEYMKKGSTELLQNRAFELKLSTWRYFRMRDRSKTAYRNTNLKVKMISSPI